MEFKEEWRLSEGCVAQARNTPVWRPHVQIISIEKLNCEQIDQYRLNVSDGKHTIEAILAIHLNKLIECLMLKPFCIVELDNYVTTVSKGKL